MKQINNGFKPYYYIDDDDGRIYNARTDKYKVEARKYTLITEEGQRKTLSAKQVYQLVFGADAHIGTVELCAGEEAREIQGFPGYLITNMGRCISRKKLRIQTLKPAINKNYLYYVLMLNGKPFYKTAHSLVAAAFCEKPDTTEPLEVHHINGNPEDNRSSNLQWLTRKQHYEAHAASHNEKYERIISR